ncbi:MULTISPECIES: hypothetical protein [Klebsiella]|uniref:hypothetical protein n=1 Tax=Klebsiella quasipneumoniae TaxID=1463165 RepID=UPI001ABF6FEA|nr:hypothetical protein [Klebsiella quasipneumoniae]HED4103679.1 hypothetical protein [Klebsiella aerogenes]
MSSLTINNTMNVSTSSVSKIVLIALASAVGLIQSEQSHHSKITRTESYTDSFTSKTSLASTVKASEDFYSHYFVDASFKASVTNLYRTLSTSSVSLGYEFEEVLADNLWDMFLE